MKVGIAVTCSVCGHRKAPIGRSVPMEMHLCDSDCVGYRWPPYAGSLWPGETEEQFGYQVNADGTIDQPEPTTETGS